jgi:hypothetical protein
MATQYFSLAGGNLQVHDTETSRWWRVETEDCHIAVPSQTWPFGERAGNASSGLSANEV